MVVGCTWSVSRHISGITCQSSSFLFSQSLIFRIGYIPQDSRGAPTSFRKFWLPFPAHLQIISGLQSPLSYLCSTKSRFKGMPIFFVVTIWCHRTAKPIFGAYTLAPELHSRCSFTPSACTTIRTAHHAQRTLLTRHLLSQ